MEESGIKFPGFFIAYTSLNVYTSLSVHLHISHFFLTYLLGF